MTFNNESFSDYDVPEQKAEGGERLARAFLNRRYAFPGDTDADKFQLAVREGRDAVRELVAALQAAREEIRRKDEALRRVRFYITSPIGLDYIDRALTTQEPNA